jgi:hypothetical protein
MDDIGPIKKAAKMRMKASPEDLEVILSNCATVEFREVAIPKAECRCLEMIELAASVFEMEPLVGDTRKNFFTSVGDADLTNPPLQA